MSCEPATIGIVTALEMESRWIGRASDTAVVEVGGVGRTRAEAAAVRLLDRGASALVSWGIAGGLDPDLEPGTVVVPEVVLGADGEPQCVDAAWRGRLVAGIDGHVPISSGSVLHAEDVVTSPTAKRELHERWRAAAVDMESAGVARVAQDAGMPWLVIRVVGDSADRELPTAVTKVADETGQLRMSAVLGLVLRPRLWPALIALGRANAAAGRSMRKVWALTRPDLALGGGDGP